MPAERNGQEPVRRERGLARRVHDLLCTPLVLRRPNYAVLARVGAVVVAAHLGAMWLDWRVDSVCRPLERSLADLQVAVDDIGEAVEAALPHESTDRSVSYLDTVLMRTDTLLRDMDTLTANWTVSGLNWESDLRGNIEEVRFRIEGLGRSAQDLTATELGPTNETASVFVAALTGAHESVSRLATSVERIADRDLALRLAARLPLAVLTSVLVLWAATALRYYVKAESRARDEADSLTVEMETRVARELWTLAAAVEQATDAIVVFGADGAALYANAAFLALCGHDSSGLLQGHVAMLGECLGEAGVAIESAVARHEPWTGRARVTARGGLRHVDVAVSPVDDPDGGQPLAVAVLRDVGDLVALEAMLRQAQKMEAVGQLAGGIAHDFNNIANAIGGHAQLLLARANGDGDVRRSAQVIAQSAGRVGELTARLLAFARRSRPIVEPVDLCHLTRSTLELVERTTDPRIALSADLPEHAVSTLGDHAQLQTALLNLIVNACDAMPDGGALRVVVRAVAADEARRAQVGDPAMEGAWVEVAVVDTGVGIDPEVLPRIFEPFFTTKGPGRGTGLGLAATYGIAKDHGGGIAVTSTPGTGSTFTLTLPAAESRPRADAPALAVSASMEGARVLVVDDDVANRELSAEVLRALGYEVIEAEDGIEALERFRAEWPALDAIVLDLTMPRLGGREVFHTMRELAPSVQVLICSGLGLESDVQDLLDAGAAGVVAKPWDIAHLASQVARACEVAREGAQGNAHART